jgi:polar amino acid transport system substrate-binding protein
MAYFPASTWTFGDVSPRSGKTDAVVNSVGALQYLISAQRARAIPMPRGIFAPAYMAFASPPNSQPKKSLDSALIEITASVEWRSLEDSSYFGR